MNKTLKTINYLGEEVLYEIPLRLYSAIDSIYHRVQNKLDGCIIITGKVGSGKTNIAKGIGGTWQDMFNNKFTLDNVFYDAENMVKFTDDEKTQTQLVLYDEAIQGGSGRDVITRAGNMLKITLITKRRKRHLYIFIVDELKELSKKIISRCNLLIDVDYKKINKKKFLKGRFKMYSAKECRDIYKLMKIGQIENVRDYRTKKRKPFMFAKLYENIWFGEKDYEKKKVKQTKLILDNESDRQNKVMQQRNRAIIKLLELKLTQIDVAKVVGLSRKTIGEIKQMTPPLAKNI